MIQTAPSRRRFYTLAMAAMAIAGGGAVGALAVTALAGTKTGAALALAGIAGPVFAYLAVVAPLIFPFGVYAVSIPFENLLDIQSFGTVTKVLGILSAFAIVFYLVRTRRAVRPPKALLVWGLLVCWAACTAFWAIDEDSLFKMLPTFIELVFLYGAISILPADRNSVRWVVLSILTGGVSAAAYGAYLARSGADLFYGGRLRIATDTSAIDPNHFAAALLLPIALCLGIAVYTRKLSTIVVALGGLVVLLLGVNATQSRGGILAIGIMFAYFFFRSKKRLRLSLITAPLLIGGLALALRTSLADRFSNAVSTGGAGRTTIWHIGFDALKQHWLLGAGYNNFPFAYDQVFLQSHQMQFAAWHHGPHDLIVGTSVELGLIGLGLLLAAWVVQFRMLEIVPPGSPYYPLRIATEAATVGLFAASLFLDVMVFKYVWLAFMLGAILRAAQCASDHSPPVMPSIRSQRSA